MLAATRYGTVLGAPIWEDVAAASCGEQMGQVGPSSSRAALVPLPPTLTLTNTPTSSWGELVMCCESCCGQHL